MSKNPLVSIIVPVYNAEKYIKRLLDSLIAQTWKNIEIICVDDESTDQSLQIIKDYCRCEKRIKCISQRNSGVSAARNTGIKNSKGDYIAFADADDFLDSYMIEKMVLTSLESGADIVSCGYYRYDQIKKSPMLCQYNGVLEQKKAIISVLNNDLIGMAVWNKLFDRKCIETIEFSVKLKINEDRLFLAEAILQANKVCVISDVLYYYCLNSGSVTAQSFSEKQLDAIKAVKKIQDIVVFAYPELKELSEAAVAKTVYNVLVLLYRRGDSDAFDLFHDKLIKMMNKVELRRVRKYLSHSLYFQFLGVQYCEPLIRTIKKLH